MRYRLDCSYDGTAYAGWQAQKNACAIQPRIEQALAQVLQVPIVLIGSGRTDAGVHALKQVAHFDTPKGCDPNKLLLSLNALLPKDIRIIDCREVDLSFHARYNVKAKTYTYFLRLLPLDDPFNFPYTFRPPLPLDLNLLEAALPYFIGKRDFATFVNVGSGARTTVRTLSSITLEKTADGVALVFIGNGFLYKMVRNLVGVLIEVARGRISMAQIETLFEARDRQQGPPPASPSGLFLTDVHY